MAAADDSAGGGGILETINPLANVDLITADVHETGELADPPGSVTNPAQHHTMPLDQDVLFARHDGLGPSAALKKCIESGWLDKVNRDLMNMPRVVRSGILKPGGGRRGRWQTAWEERGQELLADPGYPYRVKKICWAPLQSSQGPTIDRDKWRAESGVPDAQAELAEVTDEDLKQMDKPGIAKMIVVYLEKTPAIGDAEKKSYTLTFQPPGAESAFQTECTVQTDAVNMFLMPISTRVPTAERLGADEDVNTLTGGVSVISVQNWDLAIVWKQLERDPRYEDAYNALKLDADRDKAVWPNSRLAAGFKAAITEGEKALIVELFDALRQAGCAALQCEDILRFMDKIQLDKARNECKDPSVAPLFEDFERALHELDKAGFFGSKGAQHEEHEAKVEECMRKLLEDDHLELAANDVALVVTDVDMDKVETLAQAKGPKMLLDAQMLRVLLRQFRRKKYLTAMAQAGLLLCSTRCREKFSDAIPRVITLLTAPNDRMEYEAQFNDKFSIRKRVRSINEEIGRGPRIAFRSEQPDEPYPHKPYFEMPKLPTGTDDCVFTHEERQKLIMSIIESPNTACTDTDDGAAFPSNCGAFIDLDELTGEDICEMYFPMHHAEAIERLQITWGMDVPARLRIAETPNRARRKGQAAHQKLPPLRAGVILRAEQPLDKIRDYFGSHLAWYFAWMGFYTDALAVPTVVGLIVWGASNMGYSQEDLPTNAFYSIFISVWATVYLELWTRAQADQAYEWDLTTSAEDESEVSVEFIKQMRSRYLSQDVKVAEKSMAHLKQVLKGVDLDTIRNDVIDYGLWYFPQRSRSRRQLVTGFITFLCCVLVMSISQILFIFEDQAEDLGVEQQTVYTIKGITAGMLIPSLKFSYHELAKKMAEWEMHSTVIDKADSVAVKEFVFGYFNSYISLLWIAFFRSDEKYPATDGMTSEELRMQQLKTELFTVMFTAQFLNLAKEVFVPWLQDKRLQLKPENLNQQHTEPMNAVIAESDRQMRCQRPKSNTDEYLKMFGYVTMFSSAFPLAPVFAFLNNIFEIRVDAAKLCFFYRRPMCTRATGIGVWLTLMKVQSVAAVIVNCALLWKFKSQGIRSLAPDFVMEFFATINCVLVSAEDSGSGSLDNSDPSCDYKSLYQTIIACVIVEHLMVIVKMSLTAFIGDEPSRIADDYFVECYFAEKEAVEYDAVLQRKSKRFSAGKAAGEHTEAVLDVETAEADEDA